MGMGSIAAKTFRHYLINQFGNEKKQFENLLKKFDVKKYSKTRKGYSSFLNGPSIKSYLNLHPTTSGSLLAMIQGGRTNNEQPFSYSE